MSDYTNPNIHRGSAITGRGLLIAVAVLVAFIFLLAYLGASSVPATDENGLPVSGASSESAITPAQPLVEPGGDPAPAVVD